MRTVPSTGSFSKAAVQCQKYLYLSYFTTRSEGLGLIDLSLASELLTIFGAEGGGAGGGGSGLSSLSNTIP